MKTYYLILVLGIALLLGCSRTVPSPSQVQNMRFPSVSGGALSGERVQLPETFAGKPAVLLIGYKQKAQFDIDRWILGLLQAEAPVKIAEIPTIAGMMPEMVQGFIDNGMRSGIPKEDWASVITVYEDAQVIINAFGNESPQNAQVVLLDRSGTVRWFSNRGYSASQVLELVRLASDL